MTTTLHQIEFNTIAEQDFDLILASSGFEKRASFQVTQLKGKCDNKIAIGFSKEMDDSTRIENDKLITEAGFELVVKKGDSFERDLFGDLFATLKELMKDEVNIYVDYSSMTRNWYAQIILFANELSHFKRVHVYFAYSFAKYAEVDKHENFNEIVEPIYGFCWLSVPHKPTALVIGLGNEIARVYGLREFFDAETFLFYSDSRYENRYSEEVEIVNKEIIDSIAPEHVFKFPISDLIYSQALLENMCKSLNEKYRVVLAPCGPKPFTLISLLTSLRLKSDIEVWRISPGDSIQKIPREANGDISVLKVSLAPIM